MKRLTTAQRREAQERIDEEVALRWGPCGWGYVVSGGAVTLGLDGKRYEFDDEHGAMCKLAEDVIPS